MRALANRSRTRAAPTPTSDSTKSDPDSEKKEASASPATAFASSVLPVPGGPTSSTPFGAAAPNVQVARGVIQVVADLPQLRHRLAGAGDVRERDRFGFALALLAPFAGELGERRDTPSAVLGADPHEEREQADQQEDREQELHDDLAQRLARLLIDGDEHTRAAEALKQALGLRARGGVCGPVFELRRAGQPRV